MVKAIPKGNPRVMEKEKMVASTARVKAMRRASIKGMEGKDNGKGAIEADR